MQTMLDIRPRDMQGRFLPRFPGMEGPRLEDGRFFTSQLDLEDALDEAYPYLDADILADLFTEFRNSTCGAYIYGAERCRFQLLVESRTDPDSHDEWAWCHHCDLPVMTDDCSTVEGDELACESCVQDHYWTCVRCEDLCSETTTVESNEYCEQCRDNYCSYCEDCETYYMDGNAADHEHAGGCGCEAPAQEFNIRNDGEPMLANDVRAHIMLPAGTISDEGLNLIVNLIYTGGLTPYVPSYAIRSIIDTADRRWQTKEGNFTKRLSKAFYKHNGAKISPDMLSTIGCIAREHSSKTSDYHIEVTRRLNMPAEEFAHEDSCWWQSYHASRCALKSNGGFGLRAWEDDDYGVSGRAWVMPLMWNEDREILMPTFDTEAPDAFMVFNGYGNLDGYTPARILAHMAGMTYKKIENFTCSPMYVNAGGYLVSSQDICSKVEALNLNVDQHSNLYSKERDAYSEEAAA